MFQNVASNLHNIQSRPNGWSVTTASNNLLQNECYPTSNQAGWDYHNTNRGTSIHVHVFQNQDKAQMNRGFLNVSDTCDCGESKKPPQNWCNECFGKLSQMEQDLFIQEIARMRGMIRRMQDSIDDKSAEELETSILEAYRS